jgi:hypothetical protein
LEFARQVQKRRESGKRIEDTMKGSSYNGGPWNLKWVRYSIRELKG